MCLQEVVLDSCTTDILQELPAARVGNRFMRRELAR